MPRADRNCAALVSPILSLSCLTLGLEPRKNALRGLADLSPSAAVIRLAADLRAWRNDVSPFRPNIDLIGELSGAVTKPVWPILEVGMPPERRLDLEP